MMLHGNANWKGEMVNVTTDKPMDWMMDIGTKVTINSQASSYHKTVGEIVGYDPSMFWAYRVKHHDGHCWWRLRNEVGHTRK